jgi:AcrR family transcriptional regulator
MENPYKRKKDPEASKQLILHTAAEIGANADWHQVTFQAIADKTGLSKGGIIHHYPSKEELLEELMQQSLAELTQWIIEEKKTSGQEMAHIAYLRFIAKKSSDLHYRRTMKVILQAALANSEYREMWDNWFTEHISGGLAADQDINSLIIMLVADGLWYADILGVYNLSDQKKEQIIQKLQKL